MVDGGLVQRREKERKKKFGAELAGLLICACALLSNFELSVCVEKCDFIQTTSSSFQVRISTVITPRNLEQNTLASLLSTYGYVGIVTEQDFLNRTVRWAELVGL
jgi:hypothetical protein